MKIKIIGTGSIRSINNSPSYLIDNNILIDMPNGNYKNLLKLGCSLEKINYVLLTHFHGDHYFDMPFYFFDKLKCENKNINICTNNSGIRKLKKITRLAFPHTVFDIYTKLHFNYIKDNYFQIGKYDVEKIKVHHGLMKAYGYIISDSKIKVGFTGDASHNKWINYMASVCDYLICDTTLEIGDDSHMGINDIIELASIYKDCKFVTTHMGKKIPKLLEKENLDNIIIGYDGMDLL